MKIPLRYGIVALIPRVAQRIGYDRRGIFAGVNDRNEYVILSRNFEKKTRALVGKSCTLYQWWSEDNCPLEPEFSIENCREVEFFEDERVVAEQFMSRRGL